MLLSERLLVNEIWEGISVGFLVILPKLKILHSFVHCIITKQWIKLDLRIAAVWLWLWVTICIGA